MRMLWLACMRFRQTEPGFERDDVAQELTPERVMLLCVA
jgi:hypothetical protein